MATKEQLAKYCSDHFPVHTAHPLFSGVSTLTEIIVGIVIAGIAFGLGWYIKGRGMAGVQIDLNNIKTDIIALKNKVDPVAPTTTPVATVVA